MAAVAGDMETDRSRSWTSDSAQQRLGSKTVAASDSDPNAARAQPSFFCTFPNSLACWMALSDEQTGLNK